jgi:hypothetical protein
MWAARGAGHPCKSMSGIDMLAEVTGSSSVTCASRSSDLTSARVSPAAEQLSRRLHVAPVPGERFSGCPASGQLGELANGTPTLRQRWRRPPRGRRRWPGFFPQPALLHHAEKECAAKKSSRAKAALSFRIPPCRRLTFLSLSLSLCHSLLHYSLARSTLIDPAVGRKASAGEAPVITMLIVLPIIKQNLSYECVRTR